MLLTGILICCAIAGLTLFLMPAKSSEPNKLNETCQNVSLFFSVLILGLALFLTINFDPTLFQGQASLSLKPESLLSSLPSLTQYSESFLLGPKLTLKLAVDGLSLSMILLMAILLPFVILASSKTAEDKDPRQYFACLFLLTAAVMGVFMAQDLLSFFIFWELELLPMYLLIAKWGGDKRLAAANKFLLYTFLGGGLILIGLLMLYWLSGAQSLEFAKISTLLSSRSATLLTIAPLLNVAFWLFVAGFCIKLPSIPVHTWLPEAHVEAPTPVSMLLAGILLKMGAYGLMRFAPLFFGEQLLAFAPILAVLGAVNILGAAVFALVQSDLKRVIAYSSISHMGFVLLGLASLSEAGFMGAIFQMFSHGLISAGLFMFVGTIYERTHTREIAQFGGLAQKMPVLFFFFLGLAMANIGLPALSGFIGESLVFYGVFSPNTLLAASGGDLVRLSTLLSVIGVVLSAAYMLWLGRRVFYGELSLVSKQCLDLGRGESFVLGSLLGGSLLLGFFPGLLSWLLQGYTAQSFLSLLSLRF